MGEDREKIQVDEDEAVRAAVRQEGDEVEGHALPLEEREAVATDDDVEGHALPLEERKAVATDDDVEGHMLINENVRDTVRDA